MITALVTVRMYVSMNECILTVSTNTFTHTSMHTHTHTHIHTPHRHLTSPPKSIWQPQPRRALRRRQTPADRSSRRRRRRHCSPVTLLTQPQHHHKTHLENVLAVPFSSFAFPLINRLPLNPQRPFLPFPFFYYHPLRLPLHLLPIH